MFKNPRFVWVLALAMLLVACESKPVVQSPSVQTVEYSASMQLGTEWVNVFRKEVQVEVGESDPDDWVECVVMDNSVWEELQAVEEELNTKEERVNDELYKMFDNTDIVSLNGIGFWSRDPVVWDYGGGGYCEDQVIYFIFEDAYDIPWNNNSGVYAGYERLQYDEDPVTLSQTLGDFYLNIDNPETGAHLGMSFSGERLYDLAEGVMLADDEKLKAATATLPVVEKSYPVDTLNTREVASFVVPQEDYSSRDVFVKLIEAVLPLSAEGPSLSFIQSTDQSGSQTSGNIDGSQDGSLSGLMFGGWGFVSGTMDGSIEGSVDSQPVLLIRGSVYVVLK